MYQKIDGVVYQVTTTKTVVDLDALKSEVADLKAMTEPSEAELIGLGRGFHPYYTDGGRVTDLEAKITEIELAVKPVVIEK